MNELTAVEEINAIVDSHADVFTELSDSIWDNPQLRWTEFDAVSRQVTVAEKYGFRVTRDVAGIPTAFSAEYGSGGPVIAFLGEYDALAGLNQASGRTDKAPDPANASDNGHGCGHHLLGSGSLLAAVSAAQYLKSKGLPGRVRYYGCPAEEAAAGKSFMVKAGAFDDVDAAVTWHPWSGMWTGQWLSLAYTQVYFRYTGIAAHAGDSPHLGRSALDAVELLNIGVNFLREHMADTSRIHYAITDAGGDSPNVVQPKATAYYIVRARTLAEMRELYRRVVKIAEAAAQMTETELSIEFDGASAELLPNDTLEAMLHRNVQALGSIPFDDEDEKAARQFLALNPQSAVDLVRERSGLSINDQRALHAGPPSIRRVQLTGSTDVGDVSWVTPTVQIMGPCMTVGTPPHSWQWVAQGKLPAAHKGMIFSAKAIASVAVDLFADSDLLERAQAEFRETTKRAPYISPIPDDVLAPPLRSNATS